MQVSVFISVCELCLRWQLDPTWKPTFFKFNFNYYWCTGSYTYHKHLNTRKLLVLHICCTYATTSNHNKGLVGCGEVQLKPQGHLEKGMLSARDYIYGVYVFCVWVCGCGCERECVLYCISMVCCV